MVWGHTMPIRTRLNLTETRTREGEGSHFVGYKFTEAYCSMCLFHMLQPGSALKALTNAMVCRCSAPSR